MTRLLQSRWTAFLAGMLLFWAAAFVTLQHRLAAAAHPEPISRPAGPSWTFQNPEVDLLISELSKEREALAARGAELEALSGRLEADRAEMNRMTRAITRLQQEFDATITRVHEEEATNLRRLARLYSSMSPEGAAAVFRELEDDAVVKLLMFIRETEAAPILELLAQSNDVEARRVAEISERLRLALNDGKPTGR